MANVGHSPFLRWPIRWRLPLLICGLLLATLAAFASVAYWYLQRALLDATHQRLQNVGRQMGTLLATSAQQRLDEARRLAATPEIAALIAGDAGGPAGPAAGVAVQAFLKSSPQTVGVEVWRDTGERLITAAQSLSNRPGPPPPARGERLTTNGPTPLAAANDIVYYEVMGEAPGGSVVIRRAVSSSSSASEAFSRLAGEISMLFGARDAGVWADLAGVKPRPPVEQGQNKAADYDDPAGTRQVGTAVPIQGTPWQIWVSIPRSLALSTANTFVASTLPFGLVVVLIGAGVTWVLASRIIRPLEELTHAAEDIAAGDLTRHVTTSARDEIGRLGQAFNTMVDRVADGYHQLDERVKERTAELQQRTAELEQALSTLKNTQDELVRREKLAMLGQLASGVGHELRNPLAVMTNAVYFLEMIQPDAPEQVREYHGLLRAQIGLSEKIVGDLLDFARIKPPRRERVPLTRILDDQLARLTILDGVRIERDIPANLPDAYVDPIQIGQVVFNLLVNAMQAMEAQIGKDGSHGKDGGVLTLRGRATPMAAGGLDATMTSGLALDVIDTGPGVAPELQAKIFEALFTTKARGIGLGLSVSRSLAESNGGTLTLSSAPGAGATFTLTLPGAPS
jgi:signal transduction histidine kinase